MNSIFKMETDLFDLWKKDKPNFVFDGVVNEEKWNIANEKILYLLREVNECNDGFDERKYLNNYHSPEYMRSRTIDNIALWSYGIQKMSQYDIWEKAESLAISSDILSSIAVVNIKKSSGGGTVDWESFEKYFADIENQRYIRQQLEIYTPTIVICGGTAFYLSLLYPETFKDKSWNITKRGIRYLIINNVIYIDYVHPNVRAPRNIVYFSLLDAVTEIKEIQRSF